jgi:hypothetical protein
LLRTRNLVPSSSRLPARAWAFSTRGARCIETSDTSVAIASFFDLRGHAPSRMLGPLAPPYGFGERMRFGRPRRPPRPPPAPARESRRLAMIRGAFHRQEPFVGSGGLYSPGPATARIAFGDARNRWMTLSRHPGPCSGLPPYCPKEAGARSSFRSTPPPTCDRRRVLRARPPFTRP